MKHVEVGLPAQVTEQQETVLQILGENPRHMHAGSGEQSGDLDERSAVFLGGGASITTRLRSPPCQRK